MRAAADLLAAAEPGIVRSRYLHPHRVGAGTFKGFGKRSGGAEEHGFLTRKVTSLERQHEWRSSVPECMLPLDRAITVDKKTRGILVLNQTVFHIKARSAA